MHRKIRFLILTFMISVLTIVPLGTAFAQTGVEPRPASAYVDPGDSYLIKSGNITASGNNLGSTAGRITIGRGCTPEPLYDLYYPLSPCRRLTSDFFTVVHACFRVPPGQLHKDLYMAVKYSGIDQGLWVPIIESNTGINYACVDLPLWNNSFVDIYLVAKK